MLSTSKSNRRIKPTKQLSKAKGRAWQKFSLYIRTRDCLKTTGTLEGGLCVTCNKWSPRLGYRCLQAGHFVPGRTGAILFDERNCHAQCGVDNVYKHGAPHEYWLFMEKTYGREIIDELLANRNITVKRKIWDYEAIEKEYRQKIERLINDN